MATLNIDAILERVQELKRDAEEKDEVIRVQQIQITELEAKTESLEAHCRDLEDKIQQLHDSSRKAEELVEKLNSLLG